MCGSEKLSKDKHGRKGESEELVKNHVIRTEKGRRDKERRNRGEKCKRGEQRKGKGKRRVVFYHPRGSSFSQIRHRKQAATGNCFARTIPKGLMVRNQHKKIIKKLL